MTDEVQDELEREQPLLGVRPWRLQFGGELRHLVDHAGQLVTDRSWRIWRQGPAAVARLGDVRVVDLQIHEVPTLRVVVVVSPAVAVAIPVRPCGLARDVVLREIVGVSGGARALVADRPRRPCRV
jgi:hypothetical protein